MKKNIPILLDNKKDYYSFIKSLPRAQLIQSEISKTKAYIQIGIKITSITVIEKKKLSCIIQA